MNGEIQLQAGPVNRLSASAGEQFVFAGSAFEPDHAILAHGRVPASYYHSQLQFEAEQEIFRKSWLFMCRADDVAKPGDFVVKDPQPTGASVIVARDRDGVIRAFHNACAHRGMRIVHEACGSAGALRCPYHGWVYGLDGALRNIPDQSCFPDVDKTNSGLKPIASEEWNGLVFINLDPAPAMSLNEYLGGYAEVLADLPLSQYKIGARYSGDISANWKLGLDANNESYHVHCLHSRTLREMCHSDENPFGRLTSFDFAGPHHSGVIPGNSSWRPSMERPLQHFAMTHFPSPPEGANLLVDHPATNREQKENWLNDQFTIFPNMILTLQADGWLIFQFWPTGRNTCRYETTVFSRAPEKPSESFALHHFAAFSRDVGLEDYDLLVHQQRALESGGIEYIQLGEQEILLRHFAAVLSGMTATGAC